MLNRLRRGLAALRSLPKRAALGGDDDEGDVQGFVSSLLRTAAVKKVSVQLPAGYPAARVDVRVTVPPLPSNLPYRFTDHVTDELGRPTETVLVTTVGGFGISRDLGETWTHIPVKPHKHHRFIHVRSIGDSEYLAQVQPFDEDPTKADPLDLLVVNEQGQILAHHPGQGTRWHGCRAVDQSNGTIMYAEYPSGGNPRPPRVFRSRDGGRTWQIVFACTPDQIRHFHFLQANPRVTGEWWLTSGDKPHESRIWVSKDDGNTWVDFTDVPSKLDIGGVKYPRSIFRLTDLVWDGDEILWGTDDLLPSVKSDFPGARLFRSAMTKPLTAREVGRSKWHVRSLVDAGDFVVVLTQSSNSATATRNDRKPSVLLMPKKAVAGAPDLVHLFDIEVHSDKPRAGCGFTYSKASRAALGGTFFSYRAPYHLFPSGHQILRWDVKFS